MKAGIVEAFHQLVKEKSIERDVLSKIIESTILQMVKKKYGTTDNFDIYVSMDKGEIELYQNKIIVEQIADANLEIDLETARKVEPNLEIGDEFVEIIDPSTFGRRLITAAKQNLNQKIKDAEKEIIFEEYKDRIGEILIGDIRQINKSEIFLNVDKVEVVLPKSEQILTERYRRGDHMRAVIKDVVRSGRGPEIIASRSADEFLIRLFEIEVPEIYDGIIEIKGIAREPGERTKIAVSSNDKRIDAVGACVGMKGIRINAIVKELNNEKIDVIPWHNEPEIFINRSMNPAKPIKVVVDQENKKAIAVVPDEQVSLAIGKGGQNKRLASKLTGFDIDIIRESEYATIVQEAKGKEIDLSDIKELSPSIVNKLVVEGYDTVQDVFKAGYDELVKIPGIGDKTAKKILEILENL